jgi:hypothetical protein
MKKIITAIAILANTFAFSQVGIGTNTPNASTILHLESTSKGFLTPSMTTSQRDLISTPPTGLQVFNTTLNQMQINAGTPTAPVWSNLEGNDWKTTGNAGTTAGTNFIGTTDDADIVFKRNNFQAGWINSSIESTGLGRLSLPTTSTGFGNTGFGASALGANTTGGANTAVGRYALGTNTTGLANVALGHNALRDATTADENTAIGSSSMDFLTTGYGNTAVGRLSLHDLTTGLNNTAIGSSSGTFLTTGSNNIAIGRGTELPSGTASHQMNIGNIIFGKNMNGTLSAPAGNIGIGTNTPNTSAILDLSSTTNGFLMPRMLSSERDAIVSPAKGLMIYNSSNDRIQLNVGTSANPIWYQVDAIPSGDQVGTIKSNLGAQGTYNVIMDNLIYSISGSIPRVRTVSGTKNLIISEQQVWSPGSNIQLVTAQGRIATTANISLPAGGDDMSTTENNYFYVINSTDNTIHKVDFFLYLSTSCIIVTKLR